MKSSSLADPNISKYVDRLQYLALVAFVVAMLSLSIFSWKSMEFSNGERVQASVSQADTPSNARANAGSKSSR